MSFARFFERPRATSGPVAFHRGAPMTWAQLQQDTAALSARLSAQSSGPVGLFCTDAYPFIVGLLAAWRAGRTVLLPGHAGDVATVDAKVWVSDGGLPEGHAALRVDVGSPGDSHPNPAAGGPSSVGLYAGSSLRGTGPESGADPRSTPGESRAATSSGADLPGDRVPPVGSAHRGVDRNHGLDHRARLEGAGLSALAPEIALVVFTSGSSGTPKSLPKTFAQLDAEVTVFEKAFGATVGDAVVLSSVTPQHFYGLMFRVLWPLWSGRPVVSESSAVPPELFAHTAEYARVVWVATPAIYRRLGPQPPFDRVRGKVVAAFSSGGVLPTEAAVQLREGLGFAATEIFGSSETGAVAFRHENGPWQPLPGVEVQRRDDDGALQLKAPYLGHADWQTMEDAIEWVPGGFRLLHRLDRVVKVEENRVALPTLETALEASPLVEQARTVLLEQHHRQLIGAAVVLTAEGRSMLQSGGRKPLIIKLRELLQPVTVPVALPRLWRFVEALPSNSVGKISQAALVKLFEADGGVVPKTAQLPAVTKVEARDTAVTLDLELDEGLAVFDGHFPDAPILAGVAQVDWAARLARAHLDVPLTFRKLEALKFQRLIQPGDPVRLELKWDAAKAKLHFAYRTGAGECSSGRIAFDEVAR